MTNLSIPTIEALSAWRELDQHAYRAVYLLLFGIASGRFDAGFNETLDEALVRITGAESDLFASWSHIKLPSLSKFADLVEELRRAISHYGEMKVLEQGLFQIPLTVSREYLLPNQICRAFTAWKSGSTQAIVFDNNQDSLPFYLANEGKETFVFSPSCSIKSYWDLAGKATGLPLSGVACGYEDVSTFLDKITPEADCYLMGPFGFLIPSAKQDVHAFLLSLLLPRMRGRIAVLSATNLAYVGNRGLSELRRALAESERLNLVVTFPGNLLEWSSISMLGLFISAAPERRNITRFADFSDGTFFAQSNRRRRRTFNEKGLTALNALLSMGQTDMSVAEVSTDRLLAEATVRLTPQNYLLELTDGDDLKTIENFPFKLSDIAEVIRPMLRRTAENGIPVREVGASDITAYGRVVGPRDTAFIEEERVSEAFERTILRRNDIVFCVKGSVARCGLVVDEPSERWTIGQMCVGIRLKPDAPISAVALWRYLRTESFGKYLKKVVPALAMQTRIAFMSAKDVENFPVPKLSPEQLSREEAIFTEQEKHLKQISELEKAVAAAEPTEMPEDWQ